MESQLDLWAWSKIYLKNLRRSDDPINNSTPVLKINDHATGGRRTKDILGGPKGWGPKKKVANVEIYVIFEVFAFCGGRTKTDFKDRVWHQHLYVCKQNWFCCLSRNCSNAQLILKAGDQVEDGCHDFHLYWIPMLSCASCSMFSKSWRMEAAAL